MARRRKSSNRSDEKSKFDKSDDKLSRAGAESNKADTGAEYEKDSEVRSKNDVAWYSKDPQLLLDATRYTFADVFGGSDPNAGQTDFTFKYHGNFGAGSYPGIFTYAIKPTIGVNGRQTDPVNVSAAELYTHVRYVNSGRKNYDPADLYMYCLTIGELYSMITFTQKIYALGFMYSNRNLFIGRPLLQSLGFDPDDIVQHLADLRYWLNTFINKVASYAIPASCSYFTLKEQMYSGLYTESELGLIKDQLYHVRPMGFYKFALENEEAGFGKLDYTPTPYEAQKTGPQHKLTLTKLNDWIKYCEGFLVNIWADEDFGLISGDIIKAFNGDIMGLVTQPDEAGIVPVYDPLMLEKFHNATVIPWIRESAMNNPVGYKKTPWRRTETSQPRMFGSIYQNIDGNIECIEAMKIDHNSTIGSVVSVNNEFAKLPQQFLDVNSAEPSPELVIEATRWHAMASDEELDGIVWNGTPPAGAKIFPLLCGSEIVCDISYTDVIRYADPDIKHPGYQLKHTIWDKFITMHGCYPYVVFEKETVDAARYASKSLCPSGPAESGRTEWQTMLIKREFAIIHGRYCPPVRLICEVLDNADATVIETSQFISSISNFTYVPKHSLARTHEVALLSVLNVPGTAKIVTN